MTTFRIKILAILFCFMVLGAQAWAASGAEATAYPLGPSVTEALEAGKYAEASQALEEALARNPDDAQASIWLARCFWELGNYSQAVNYAERAVRLDADSSEFHLWLGRAYGQKAEKEKSFFLARKARQEFQTSVQLDPNNLQARRDLMEFYLEAPWVLGGSKDKAWKQAGEIASRDAVAGYLARAICWQRTGKTDQAGREYQKLLKMKPERVDPYFEVADFAESQGNSEEIKAVVRAASIVQPDDPRLTYYRGVAAVIEGRELPRAEEQLKTYLMQSPQRNDFPSHAAAHDWLARLYERRGNIREAIEQYQTALRLNPDNQTAHKELQRLEAN